MKYSINPRVQRSRICEQVRTVLYRVHDSLCVLQEKEQDTGCQDTGFRIRHTGEGCSVNTPQYIARYKSSVKDKDKGTGNLVSKQIWY